MVSMAITVDKSVAAMKLKSVIRWPASVTVVLVLLVKRVTRYAPLVSMETVVLPSVNASQLELGHAITSTDLVNALTIGLGINATWKVSNKYNIVNLAISWKTYTKMPFWYCYIQTFMFCIHSYSTSGTGFPNLVDSCRCGGGSLISRCSGLYNNNYCCPCENQETKEGMNLCWCHKRMIVTWYDMCVRSFQSTMLRMVIKCHITKMLMMK